jgi:non-ribosomal peptide synthetase-like protein
VVLLCAEIAATKWILLGRVKPGRFPVYSGRYFRSWFIERLMELSLDVIGPLYATIYLIPWYRLLGARLGRRSEVSTASFISPDLLTMGEEGFIADDVSLGAPRVEDGHVTLDRVRVGDRAFVGNSACLPPGTDVGRNSLIGCMTIPPAFSPGSEVEETSWLGSPSFRLPRRQESTAFGAEFRFNPPFRLWLERATIELVRVTLPVTAFLVLTCLLLSSAVAIAAMVHTSTLVLIFPLLYWAFGLAAALLTITIKWVVIGRYVPGEHPLWSGFVWRTELVAAVHEHLGRLFFVDMLHGTPLARYYYRLLGLKIGKRVFLNTGEFTEFDLIEIGDDAALNEDCTIQTHLFEDRVMKMSNIVIGPRASVGSMAVVLYDSQMEEGSTLGGLSLLMKGEKLPANTVWAGIPARTAAVESHAAGSTA